MDFKIWFSIYFVVCKVVEAKTIPIRHNDKFVRKCSKCPPGWGVIEKCSEYRDTLCQKCEYGKSYSSYYSSTDLCWHCSLCGIGLYEARRCSPTKDTVCNECTLFIGNKNFTEMNDFYQKCRYILFSKYKN